MHNTPHIPDEKRKRVLIIKPGYSETLDPDESGIVSLGDILRTTVILHLFPSDQYHVTWLVDKRGIPLLKGNTHIHRLLAVNPFTPHLLLSEWFDIVVNFEKEPGICAVSDRIPAWRRFGFRLDPQSHAAVAYDHSDEALSFTNDSTAKRKKAKSWSEILYEMLGHKLKIKKLSDLAIWSLAFVCNLTFVILLKGFYPRVGLQGPIQGLLLSFLVFCHIHF